MYKKVRYKHPSIPEVPVTLHGASIVKLPFLKYSLFIAAQLLYILPAETEPAVSLFFCSFQTLQEEHLTILPQKTDPYRASEHRFRYSKRSQRSQYPTISNSDCSTTQKSGCKKHHSNSRRNQYISNWSACKNTVHNPAYPIDSCQHQ